MSTPRTSITDEDSMTMTEFLALQREYPPIRLADGTTLAEPCTRCRGKRRSPAPDYEPCDLCEARGYVLTPDGKQVMRLIALFPLGPTAAVLG